MILKDGHIIWIEAYDTPIREADGTIVWTGYGNDITQRKSYETALNESESKFRAFVENANDIIYSLSLDGLLTYVSPNWTEILGHPLSDVIGRNFDQFVHPDDVSACHIFCSKYATVDKNTVVLSTVYSTLMVIGAGIAVIPHRYFDNNGEVGFLHRNCQRNY